MDERLKFIRNGKMCFGCLKKGTHFSKDCKKKLKCETCSRSHPTVLHREASNESQHQNNKSDKDNKVNCSRTGAGDNDSYPTIIPVTVYSCDTGIAVNTYAYMDGGSDAVFCTTSLQTQLHVTGKRTKLDIETITETKTVDCQVLHLEISDLDRQNIFKLQKVYTQETIPADVSDVIKQEDIDQFDYLSQVRLPVIHDATVGLLIGNNVPSAMKPLEVVNSREGGPYAVRTALGWSVHGVSKEPKTRKGVRRVKVHSIEDQLERLYNYEFPERLIEDVAQPSEQDKQFLAHVEKTTKLINGHYEIGLPVKYPDKEFPNNLHQAKQRATHLKNFFLKDPIYFENYKKSVNEMFQNGYAEEIPANELPDKDNRKWYIPHHGVVHPQKNKLRVVFDCAATYFGQSLNSRLLQGPDLTNNLTGVLMRFRQHPIAIISDIEAMYYQVRVPDTDRDLMRFLWWQNDDLSSPLKEYRMCVHVFGATSSPACANYALKRAAEEAKETFSEEACNTITSNFYVDDCLTSVANEHKAVQLVEDLTNVCKNRGFRLTKWLSNSKKVMECIPQTERAKSAKSLDLDRDNLPSEKVLGLLWNPQSDTLGFHICLKEHPCTRRGILAAVSSMYDPLGFIAPAILPAKRILQNLCKLQLGWDESIPPNFASRWDDWRHGISCLSDFSIDRCIKPEELSRCVSTQLHHFSDASESGYGTASYVRHEDACGSVHVSLLIAKARVAPLKKVTIPRLELTAATSMVKMNSIIQRELQFEIDDVYYWTDSETVLKYICNSTARFQTFVANRVALIKDGSQISQWRHVQTKVNPADACSRGVSAETLVTDKSWTTGPDFLYNSEEDWPNTTANYVTSDLSDDLEVKKKVKVNVVTTEESIKTVDRLIAYFSSWYKLCRSVAWIIKVKNLLLQRVKTKHNEETSDYEMSRNEINRQFETNTDISSHLSVKDIKEAEETIIGYEQRKCFPEEWKLLANQQLQDQPQMVSKDTVKKSSPLHKLNPFMQHSLLRVGGRLGKSSLPEDTKFPIILPKKSVISDLIMHQAHEATGHGGRNFMLAHVYQWYWIISANSIARRIIHRCVVCRKQRAKVCEQQMADLPRDRVTAESPPFTFVGVDYFGPFSVKRGRSVVKRYGVLFTCLTTRAIHVEKADALDTDNCINAIRRFIARRGQVRELRSDNGTNLVGAERELREEIKKWKQAKFTSELLQRNVDWKFNPPAGSHFGGVWERQIRTFRKIMFALVKQQLLTDDSLSTLFCEIEAIVNNRPITAVQGSAEDLEPLTPSMLLLMKNTKNLPPTASDKSDQYAKRRWRQIQYLTETFWRRWSREYLTQLQERQKWNKPHVNLQVGDIVLVADSNRPRNSWQLGRIVETYPDGKGLVRQAKVQTTSGELVRPVAKLCLLVEPEVEGLNDNEDTQSNEEQASDEPQIRPKRIRKKPHRLDL